MDFANKCCPMAAHPGDARTHFNCLGPVCAWWDETKECCVIVSNISKPSTSKPKAKT